MIVLGVLVLLAVAAVSVVAIARGGDPVSFKVGSLSFDTDGTGMFLAGAGTLLLAMVGLCAAQQGPGPLAAASPGDARAARPGVPQRGGRRSRARHPRADADRRRDHGHDPDRRHRGRSPRRRRRPLRLSAARPELRNRRCATGAEGPRAAAQIKPALLGPGWSGRR